jgi:hypothetical protein
MTQVSFRWMVRYEHVTSCPTRVFFHDCPPVVVPTIGNIVPYLCVVDRQTDVLSTTIQENLTVAKLQCPFYVFL